MASKEQAVNSYLSPVRDAAAAFDGARRGNACDPTPLCVPAVRHWTGMSGPLGGGGGVGCAGGGGGVGWGCVGVGGGGGVWGGAGGVPSDSLKFISAGDRRASEGHVSWGAIRQIGNVFASLSACRLRSRRLKSHVTCKFSQSLADVPPPPPPRRSSANIYRQPAADTLADSSLISSFGRALVQPILRATQPANLPGSKTPRENLAMKRAEVACIFFKNSKSMPHPSNHDHRHVVCAVRSNGT